MHRRAFLHAAAGGTVLVASGMAADSPLYAPPKRIRPPVKKLAIICSVYYYLSHAYHIGGRFLHGYLKDGQHHYPEQGIASVFVEQRKANDLSRGLSEKYGFQCYDSIADALTLGTGKLAVDGVLLICEHGDYPYNARGQKLYPRFEMFEKILEVFKASKRVVPVFNDKHLSYDRKKAFAMVDSSRKMGFPLMAGSSLPVTWRRPELELPIGTKIREALVASRGEMEIYGIHAMEALQCMVERRAPGQQGVKAVECLEGEAVWKAADEGRWSWELLEHALGRSPSRNAGDIRENCRSFQPPTAWGYRQPGPRAFLIEYRDGLKATILQIDGHAADETFAARIEGEKKPVSCLFYLPPPPGAAFLEALSRHVETFMSTGKAPYPIERNLLTSAVLDALLESRATGKRVETPELDIRYEPPKDSGFMRGDYTAPR